MKSIIHDALVVAAGSSRLCDAATGCTLERKVLPQDVVMHATNSLVEDGHKVLILKDAHATGYDYLTIGDGELDPASEWWFQKMSVQVRHIDCVEHDRHPGDTVRAGVVACETKLCPKVKDLRESLGDRCFLQHWSAVTASHATGSNTHLLEIFTINVNKWTMIEDYCERAGIDPSRVAAIGDGLNDVELIEHAGLGVAMANAIPAVLVLADQVTADHDDDGVALAIARILNGEW